MTARMKFWELFLRWCGVFTAASSLFILPRYLGRSLGFSWYHPFDAWIVLAIAGAAVIVTGVWARLQHDAARIHFLLQFLVRLVIAPILLIYGLSKVQRGQFYPSFLSTLDSTVSEMSGNALTWAYFGRSYPYSVFVGLAEVLAATFLLTRRTQLVGGLLTMSIFANIAVIDFSYDVGGFNGVKLVSLIGLAAGLYLMAVDAPRLLALFWGGEALPAARHPWGERGWRFAAAHCVLMLVWLVPDRLHAKGNIERFLHSETPIHGIWDVTERDVPNGSTLTGWSRVYFDDQRTTWDEKSERDAHRRHGGVRDAAGMKSIRYWVVGRSIEIVLSKAPNAVVFRGEYAIDGADLRLLGTQDGKPVRFVLQRRELRPRGEDVW
jgi:hypothetical protein